MSKQKTFKNTQKSWAETEFSDTDFGDERLNNRLIRIAEGFAEAPECPINQACEDWAETKAAYRFFQNDKIQPEGILKSHVKRTAERLTPHNVVLCIQDTCYLSYSHHKKTTGLGIIAKTNGTNVKEIKTEGLLMHTAFAISTNGLPLGILHQKIYTRTPRAKEPLKQRTKSHATNGPIEKKESYRWLETLRKTKAANGYNGVDIVTICDREGDFYELIEESERISMPVLVRAKVDRVINKISPRSGQNNERLWENMAKQEACGNFEVEVPANDKRSKRTATLTLRFSSFVLNPPPVCYRNGNNIRPDIKLYSIYVTEPNPPDNVEPLEWMLITNLAINNYSEALEKVHWYCLRWRIEVFHKILKSGFNVEGCRLQSAERLTRYLTVISIVAWRIYKVNLLARENPEAPCCQVLTKEELSVLYCKFKKTKTPPKKSPTVRDAIRWIAMLGGFLARKGDGEPGTITLWRGWKRLFDLTEGWQLASKS